MNPDSPIKIVEVNGSLYPHRTKAFYAHYQNDGASDMKRVALGLHVLSKREKLMVLVKKFIHLDHRSHWYVS